MKRLVRHRNTWFISVSRGSLACLSTSIRGKDVPPPVVCFDYRAGDDSDVSAFVSVPVRLIEQLGNEELAGEHFTGLSRCYLIHYNNEKEDYDETHAGALDGQFLPQIRLTHYGACAIFIAEISACRQGKHPQ